MCQNFMEEKYKALLKDLKHVFMDCSQEAYFDPFKWGYTD